MQAKLKSLDAEEDAEDEEDEEQGGADEEEESDTPTPSQVEAARLKIVNDFVTRRMQEFLDANPEDPKTAWASCLKAAEEYSFLGTPGREISTDKEVATAQFKAFDNKLDAIGQILAAGRHSATDQGKLRKVDAASLQWSADYDASGSEARSSEPVGKTGSVEPAPSPSGIVVPYRSRC